MKPVRTVLFDLDGTLTDPGVGITNSVAYALSRFGISVPDRKTLYPFIGPPLVDSFMEHFAFSEEKAKEAVTYYREYFSSTGIFENKVYDSVPEMLTILSGSGLQLVVASSKPEPFVRRILDHFGLTDDFLYIAGSELDHRRVNKHEVIEYALSSSGITDREASVMIGDRHHDIEGAKLSGIRSVGVLYGYGTREELEEAGADHIADSVSALTELILLLSRL